MSDDFEVVDDDAREARVVAAVLGEASGFEQEEVARLCEQNPELAVFRRRVEAVHGLLDEKVGEKVGEESEAQAAEWKLSEKRRSLILAKVEGDALEQPHIAAMEPRRKRKTLSWQYLAATLVLAATVLLLASVAVSSLGSSESGELAVTVAEYRSAGSPHEDSAAQEDGFSGSKSASARKVSVERKPSAPSSAMGRAIASNTVSASAIPVPEVAAEVELLDFGDRDDYGSGWGGRKGEAIELERGLAGGGSPPELPSKVSGLTERELNSVSRGFPLTGGQELKGEAQNNKITPFRNELGSSQDDAFAAWEAAPFMSPAEEEDDPFAADVVQKKGNLAFRQETQSAVDLLMEGRKAYAAKDYEKANKLYKDSLNSLPEDERNNIKRGEIIAHLSDGATALAQQYRRTGKYTEAEELLGDALLLQDRNASDLKANRNFDDPIRTNPSLAFDHSKKVDEVRRLLYQGEGYYNLADYDASGKLFHEVLKIDPYNKAARRWLERTASIKSDYYRAAYDHTRARLMSEVDKSWELTVPSSRAVPDELGLFSSLLEEPQEDRARKENAKVSKPLVSAVPSVRPDEQPDVISKLENIMIPSLDFEDVTLEEAVAFLNQKAFELDPSLSGEPLKITIESPKSENASDSFIFRGPQIESLKLRDVSMAKALQYVADMTGRRYRIDGEEIVLLALGGGADGDIPMRSWNLSPEAYRALMATMPTAFGNDEEVMPGSEREVLTSLGVTFPQGSDVCYLPESNTLVGRNTMANLDIIDQLIARAEREAQVAQETLHMDEKDAAIQGDSTFSLNVSDVSFKLAKAALAQGQWPETVRVEEFVNAFSYQERKLAPQERVGLAMEQAAHPFLSQRNLLRLSLQTAATGRGAGVPLRLTVVLDKSGSMERLDRARAVEEAFRVLVSQLQPQDRVTLVGFARTPTLLADFVSGTEGEVLLKILRQTPSEGGTNLEEALKLAQTKAREHFLEGAQNRVILLTDGVANLGNAVPEELMTLVTAMRGQEIAFDACGVGVEGVNDEVLEALTRKGDGRYYLLSNTEESGADLAKQVAGALRPAAMNVKVQVEWNPDRVGKWRLYGFEKHELKKEDFRNDAVDAAEMAAEEEGVAVYHAEVKPTGEGPLGVARVRFLDVARNEMVEREWEIPYEGEAATLREADPKVRLAGVAALTAEKLARSVVGERAEWDDLLAAVRQLKSVFPKEPRVQDLERMIEQAKNLE